MSSSIPVSLHPVLVCEDRYSGVYSGAAWRAVAKADMLLDGVSRIAWLWEHGPGSDDVDAAIFWGRPPPWIASASTPDAAVAGLVAQDRNDSDDWALPAIEEDPRYRPFNVSPPQ